MRRGRSGWEKSKPSATSRPGSTRADASSSPPATPPSLRSGSAGTRTTAGRCSWRASSRANSACVVVHIKGIQFSAADLALLEGEDAPCHLLAVDQALELDADEA